MNMRDRERRLRTDTKAGIVRQTQTDKQKRRRGDRMNGQIDTKTNRQKHSDLRRRQKDKS